jgi:hypothetical protein
MWLPFRLYGLDGCPHCREAWQFINGHKMPADMVVANNDPVIEKGIVAVIGGTEAQYPVLVSRLTSEIIVGWKPEDYDRLAKVFETLIRTGSLGIE